MRLHTHSALQSIATHPTHSFRRHNHNGRKHEKTSIFSHASVANPQNDLSRFTSSVGSGAITVLKKEQQIFLKPTE